MIREQHLRLDHFGRFHQLFRRHCIRLVARQESNVNVPDICHFRNVLCVASNIDSQTIDRQDITVVTAFGVKLRTALSIIVGRNSLHREAISYLQLVAIGHHLARAQHVGTPLVGDKPCLAVREQADGSLVEVVTMLVGHKDVVGLRHRGKVNDAVTQLGYRVNHYLLAVILHADAGVDKGMELDGLSALRFKHIHLVCIRSHGLPSLFPR